MWDSVGVGAIIAVCAFFIGRKVYRQLKAAANPAAGIECGCSCSGGCSVSGCHQGHERHIHPQE